ncbi:MAG: choice-of-anchor J domain-containing protein, partial [Muribaculaceae bacterium]|nr:choice-of-anchor J domain-containing protein [Muribaculaceae bacterium]
TLFNNECATWNGNYDDGSDSRWSVYKPYGATAYYFQYKYDSTRDADDWLFLPDLQLEAAKYKISYAYKCQGASYPETFYVTIGQGKTCTAQTTVVASHIDFSNIVDESNTAIIDVPSAGVWNLALHATSPANRYNFFVRDIHIEKVDNDAPAEPAFSYTADGLDATVTVTFPDKTISDTAIPAATSITATVTVEGCDDTFTLTGTPGATQNFSVTFPDSGDYTVSGTVQYSDASGLHTSQPASSTITVRKKKPAFLEQGYTILPDIDQAEWMTYVDANDDHNTFYFESNRHLPTAISTTPCSATNPLRQCPPTNG